MWLRQLGLLVRQAAVPVAVIAVVVIGAAAVFGYLNRDERQVQRACEAKVAGELRSPASASYTHTLTWEPSPGTWIDNGDVDAQNGFGAMIRSKFRCDVVRHGGEWVTTVFLV